MGSVLLVGCSSGSVETSDIEDFGAVRSASWRNSYDFTIYRLSASGDLERNEARYYHRLLLSDVKSSCEDEQQYMAARDQATRDLLASSSDGTDAQAVCDGMATLIDKYIEAARYQAEPTHQFIVHFIDEAPLDELSYSFTLPSLPPTDPGAFGFVYYSDKDQPPEAYYLTLQEAWDPNVCAFDSDVIDAYFDNESILWGISDGTIDLEVVEFESAIVGSFETNIVDEEGGPAGAVSGTFNASFCDESGDYKILSL